MKQNYLYVHKSKLLFLVLISFFSLNINAQCTTGTLYPSGTFSVPCTGVPLAIATDSWPGEYSNVTLVGNELYTFNSSVSTDYATITTAGGALLGFGNVPLQLALVSGQTVRFYLHKNSSCVTEDVDRTKFVTCNSPCSNPSALTASNISTNSFQISWQGTSPSSQIYVSQSAIPPTNPTIETQQGINGNIWLVNGSTTLMYPATTYNVWVRSECIGVTNPWVGPISVTTNPETAFCSGANYGLYPQATFVPACTNTQETIVADAWASEFSKVSIFSNTQYTFTSSNNSDYISITNEAGTAVYSFGQTPLVWNTGSISGIIRYITYSSINCGTQAVNRTRFIRCSQAQCNPPTNLNATSITANSATLTYSSSSAASNGYDYLISTTNSAPIATTNPSGNSATLNAPLSGLNGSTTYFYWVRANCGATKSAWVAGGSFTTLVAPPFCAPATNFSSSNLTSNSVILAWAANSSFETFDIFINTSNTAPTAATTPIGTNLAQIVLVSPLNPSTTYYYWVRTNCGSSLSVWQSGGSFTTLPTVSGGCNGALYGLINIANFLPACNGSVIELANGIKAGQFMEVGIQTNRQYTFTSTISSDYFTVTNNAGNVLLGSGQHPYAWNSGSNTGFVRVFLHSNSSCGNSFTGRIASVQCQNSLSDEEFEHKNFVIFPNPVRDILNVTNEKIISSISIYNLLGQEVVSKTINDKHAKIDMSSFPKGAYLAKINADGTSKTVTIIKE